MPLVRRLRSWLVVHADRCGALHRGVSLATSLALLVAAAGGIEGQAFWYGTSGTGGGGLWFTPLPSTGWGCPSPAAPCPGPNGGQSVFIGFPGFAAVTGAPRAFSGSVGLNGTAIIGNLTLGAGGSAFGPVNFSPPSGNLDVGAGSVLTVTGLLTLGGPAQAPFSGAAGTGTLTVSGGAVAAGPVTMGAAPGATGALTVSAHGSLTSSGPFVVGSQGSGTLLVSSGGTVSVSGNSSVATLPGSSGVVRVSGPGSSWTTTGTLAFGNAGTPSLTISQGGIVNSGGSFFNGNGTVTDAGSQWNNAFLEVGTGSNPAPTGTLTISNGGVVQTSGGGFIGSFGGTGSVSVTGSGSSWSMASLNLGGTSQGSLSVTSGGYVNSGVTSIGAFPGSTGIGTLSAGRWDASFLAVNRGSLDINLGGVLTVSGNGLIDLTGSATVQDPGSTFNLGGVLTLGPGGQGLTVMGGATGSSGAVEDGGSMMISGAGSKWTATTGDFVVGQVASTGSLLVANGGEVQNNGNSFIGLLGGAASVTGAGSQWNSASLSVGYGLGAAGHLGQLTVQNGGFVSTTNGIVVGDYGGIGAVNVTGAGSQLVSSSVMDVGNGFNGGVGSLDISNGGVAASGSGLIGTNAGGTGTVAISGPGSSWTQASDLFVGNGGAGTLTVTGGGSGTTGQDLIVAEMPGATGTLTILGAGSSWTVVRNLAAGVGGQGAVDVLGGGTLNVGGNTFIASGFGSGTIGVQGGGSTFNTAGHIDFVNSGTPSLLVSGGGVVNSGGAFFNGTATVTGTGSQWNTSFLQFGPGVQPGPRASLTVTSGGLLNSGITGIGNALTPGTLTVNGPGSRWNASAVTMAQGSLIVDSAAVASVGALLVGAGTAGQGSVLVSAGASLQDANATIGAAGSTGSVVVDSGSWLTTGAVQVGVSGTGSVKVRNNGVLSAGSMLIGQNGTLNIDPATADIIGDFTLLPGGALLLGVSGQSPSLWSRLFVGGFGLFQGNIFIDFMNGFAPSAGSVFDLISASGGADFSQASFAVQGVRPGFQYSTSFSNGTFSLTALNDGTVTPEPVSMLLFGTGLAGIAAAARRRQKRRWKEEAA